jgi:Uma2 family endonuclease
MVAPWAYDETIELPGAIRFPVELEPPESFDPVKPATWPKVTGRLEYVEGRLLYMPPCGDAQQYTVTDVVIVLGSWARANRDFVLGTNEAGMHLRGATRAADAAIWRRADAGPVTGGLQRRAPILAVEVAGRYEPEQLLRDKARWYLDAGVQVVWLVFPETRDVLVVTPAGEARFGPGNRLPEHAELSGLIPDVDDLFVQVSGG